MKKLDLNISEITGDLAIELFRHSGLASRLDDMQMRLEIAHRERSEG